MFFFFFNLEKPCTWLNLICLHVYRPSRWHTSELICLVKNGKWFRRNLWERSDLMTFLLMFRGQNLSLSVSFFLRWSIFNKYFKLLYSLWLSMRLWFQKISFFFYGQEGEEKTKISSCHTVFGTGQHCAALPRLEQLKISINYCKVKKCFDFWDFSVDKYCITRATKSGFSYIPRRPRPAFIINVISFGVVWWSGRSQASTFFFVI